jgi:DNA-binding NarL/FixJ family response regulator
VPTSPKCSASSDASLYAPAPRAFFDERYIQGLGGKRGNPVPLLSPRGQLLDPGFARHYARPHPAWGPIGNSSAAICFPPTSSKPSCAGPIPPRQSPRARQAQVLHHPDDPPEFWGWRWICPACKKPVRTIYYPLPVRTMFDRWFIDPAQRLKLGELNLPEPPLPTFACRKCHNVQYISTTDRHGWNQIITYLSAGLLYGCEVPKPASFTPERKRTRIRQLHRQAPMRRKVLTRLANGWSNFQIAKDLQISRKAVNQHIYIICKEEDVPDRHALADKLNFAVSPPLNYIERALARRFQVREMLLQNCTYQEMCKELSASFSVISADVVKIFRQYGVKGHGFKARRALAKLLNVPFQTAGDHTRQKIAALRETGLSCKQVAKAVGLSKWMVCSHISILRKQKVMESLKAIPNSLDIAQTEPPAIILSRSVTRRST